MATLVVGQIKLLNFETNDNLGGLAVVHLFNDAILLFKVLALIPPRLSQIERL